MQKVIIFVARPSLSQQSRLVAAKNTADKDSRYKNLAASKKL